MLLWLANCVQWQAISRSKIMLKTMYITREILLQFLVTACQSNKPITKSFIFSNYSSKSDTLEMLETQIVHYNRPQLTSGLVKGNGDWSKIIELCLVSSCYRKTVTYYINHQCVSSFFLFNTIICSCDTRLNLLKWEIISHVNIKVVIVWGWQYLVAIFTWLSKKWKPLISLAKTINKLRPTLYYTISRRLNDHNEKKDGCCIKKKLSKSQKCQH